MKTARKTVSAGAVATTIVTFIWDRPFPSDAYTIATAFDFDESENITERGIVDQSASQCRIAVRNSHLTNNKNVVIHVTATHDDSGCGLGT